MISSVPAVEFPCFSLLYIIAFYEMCLSQKQRNKTKQNKKMIQFLWNDLKLSFGVDSISNYYKRHIDRRT